MCRFTHLAFIKYILFRTFTDLSPLYVCDFSLDCIYKKDPVESTYEMFVWFKHSEFQLIRLTKNFVIPKDNQLTTSVSPPVTPESVDSTGFLYQWRLRRITYRGVFMSSILCTYSWSRIATRAGGGDNYQWFSAFIITQNTANRLYDTWLCLLFTAIV